MYYFLWKKLPGGSVTKALYLSVLLVVLVVVLFVVVFPGLEGLVSPDTVVYR